MMVQGDNILITEVQLLQMVNTIRKRHFRRITEDDGQRMEHAFADKYMGTSFYTQGNFTGALICFKNGGHAVGMTRRCHKDRNKPAFARMQALSRAINYALTSIFYDLGIKLLPKEKPAEVGSAVTIDLTAKTVPPVDLKANGDIPRTMEGVAAAIVYPLGKGG